MKKKLAPEHAMRIFVITLYSFFILVVVGLAVVYHTTKIPLKIFTSDPATSMKYSPLYGCVSNICVLLWCAAAVICFFAAAVLYVHKDQIETFGFLGCFGILTTVLMLDDLFVFHEYLAQRYLHIPENFVVIVYGVLALLCLWRFHRTILAYDSRYLMLSFAGFGISIFVDAASYDVRFTYGYLVEDGAKLFGIISWLVYFTDFSYRKILAVVAQNSRFGHFVNTGTTSAQKKSQRS